MNKSKNRAFTLVELLIVVAIIALLTGMIMTNFGSSRGKARDGKRISDVGQLQLALELYFDRCNAYPDGDGGTIDPTSGCSPRTGEVVFTDFISSIPTPPPNAGQNYYEYKVNFPERTDYVLKTNLEYPNEVVKDGLSNSAGQALGMTGCDNSATSLVYCIGPK